MENKTDSDYILYITSKSDEHGQVKNEYLERYNTYFWNMTGDITEALRMPLGVVQNLIEEFTPTDDWTAASVGIAPSKVETEHEED